MSDRSTPLSRYFVLAAFLQIVWGLVPSASKIVIEEIPVELYIALRWTISSLVIAAILLIRTRSLVPMRRDAAIAGGLGILGYALSSFGTLYVLGPDGRLEALRVRTGLSDGSSTEVEGSRITEGLRVIAGIVTTTATPRPAANPLGGTQQQGGGRRPGGGF